MSSDLLRNRVQTITRRHDSFDADKDWLKYVYDKFTLDSKTRIAYVLKFRFPNVCIFTIQQYGEIMTPEVAASAGGVAPSETDLRDADHGPISLEDTLKHWEDKSFKSHLCISDNFNETGDIIIRWNENRTLYSTYKKER